MIERLLTPRGRSVLALLAYTSFIAYQSLADGGSWQCGGVALGLHGRLSRSDLLANVVAYVPLGLLVVLAGGTGQQRRRSPGWLALAGASLPAALSLALELVQSCEPARVSSAYDWIANTLGGAGGAAVGLLLLSRAWTGSDGRPAAADRRLRVLTAGVAAGWVISQTMPWVFAVDLGTIRGNLSFLRGWSAGPGLDGWHVLRHAGAWVAIACACRLAAREARLAWSGLALVALVSVGLQTLLHARAPLSFEELAGMLLAGSVVLAAALATRRWMSVTLWSGGLFVGAWLAMAAYELRPDLVNGARTSAFSWWPRVGLGGLSGAIDYALLFGWFGFAAVIATRWAERSGHRRARYLGPAVAVGTMLALELAQTRIPGRGPDVSAPLFTLLAVLVAAAIVRSPSDGAPP